MSKKTKYVEVMDNTLFIQVFDPKKGKDRVWRQKGIVEQNIPWFNDSRYEEGQISKRKEERGLDLDKFKEDYNV